MILFTRAKSIILKKKNKRKKRKLKKLLLWKEKKSFQVVYLVILLTRLISIQASQIYLSEEKTNLPNKFYLLETEIKYGTEKKKLMILSCGQYYLDWVHESIIRFFFSVPYFTQQRAGGYLLLLRSALQPNTAHETKSLYRRVK